ncbi:MAG: HAMP domain-containing sensor histidine kinase [Muricomes sp.]|uniref:sensor histidine kinase n=1 Tax=Faecalicatena contorta TaxID=39482 RepID=UPI002EB55B51|nr:HAMP domain-containing sensor histidine kinase [Muricomes sp.]
MFWLGILCAVLGITVVILLVKIALLHRAADEIHSQFIKKLENDTNTLILLSTRDRYMCRLAEEINVQLRELRAQRRRFQQGDFELKEAVTNISHDLRTPLTAICGYLDLLEQEEISETAGRYLTVIKERSETLKQLTEELFRYSVITSAHRDANEEDIILNHVLEESISAYYAALKNSRIEPQISIPEEKIRRRLDKKSVSRIFSNIINNAVKYSDGDLHITLREDGEIIFYNHASRLNEIQVGRLFDRFYTVEAADKSTGLGLSIAKILTEQMHGKISARYNNGVLSIHVRFEELEISYEN